MRFVEKGEARGSLKWIRLAVNDHADLLNNRILEALGLREATPIVWTSPLKNDEFAEYRDQEFVDRIDTSLPVRQLESFWPVRGPQWDALAKVGNGGVLLVEAKANIPEIVSTGTGAGGASLELIKRSLDETKDFLGIDADIPWTGKLYQIANRLAHLYLMRELNQQDAYLVFLYFTGDSDVDGPQTIDEWKAALTVAKGVLGIPKRHPLYRYVAE